MQAARPRRPSLCRSNGSRNGPLKVATLPRCDAAGSSPALVSEQPARNRSPGVGVEGRSMRSAGDQRGHEVVVPGGGLALALEASLQCRVGAREVERDLAEQGQVPGGGALAHPARVFIETDVEHPVKSVLDRPMASYGGGE